MRYVYEKPNKVYALDECDTDVLPFSELVKRLKGLNDEKAVFWGVDVMDCEHCQFNTSDGCIYNRSPVVYVNEKRYCRSYKE